MDTQYQASAIEVLSGLAPVQRRPGMYTDTSRPNHLAQEVIDNSVDEALAGFANRIDVILHSDQSLTVSDNGRGMPVDIHRGTHVNGLRAGLLEAIREFCDYRNLLPRGVKLAPDDVWVNCAYVLSVKLPDPQFAGQTKERTFKINKV